MSKKVKTGESIVLKEHNIETFGGRVIEVKY